MAVAVADDEELARAREACATIVERGYARGRPLVDLLATAISG